VNPELGVRIAERSPGRRAEAEVRAAIAFLTRLPVATTSTTIGASAFGLVGAVIGAIGALAVLVVGGAAPIAAGALAVAAMALVTGALHLDGLGDTADALAASTPEAAERARLDPRLGAAGVVAIGVALVLDASLLGALIERIGLAGAALVCVTAASASRAVVVLTAWTRRDRTRPGGGAWLVSHLTVTAVAVTTGTALLVAVVSTAVAASLAVAIGAVVGCVVGVLGATWLVRLRGGLDGDGLGATVELSFAAILLAIVLLP